MPIRKSARHRLTENLDTLSIIFSELSLGVCLGLITGQRRKVLEQRVRQLFRPVKTLAVEAGLRVWIGRPDKHPAQQTSSVRRTWPRK
jgi:hypothetical protein